MTSRTFPTRCRVAIFKAQSVYQVQGQTNGVCALFSVVRSVLATRKAKTCRGFCQGLPKKSGPFSVVSSRYPGRSARLDFKTRRITGPTI